MLAQKKILVIGAGGLLGTTLVSALLSRGATVVAADIAAFEAQVDGDTNLIKVIADINAPDQLASLFAEHPDLDGAVNCTYPRTASYGKAFFDVTLDSFNDNVSVHLGSAFLFAQQAAKHFTQHQRPFSLVNLASIYGVVAPRFSIYEDTPMTMPVEYAAIKAAILQLTRYVTAYVNDSRFRVNAISPGGIKDGQPEAFLARYKSETLGTGMLTPSDLCGAVAFLLSDDSRFMQGQNLIVDDGFSL